MTKSCHCHSAQKYLEMLQFALLVASVCFSTGQSQQSDDTVRQWDDLISTWGRFDKLPRTVEDATSQGFVLNTTTHLASRCKPFLGNRYVENDTGVMLLYDAKGYIAGIQIGFDKNLPNNDRNYPSPFIRPPWLKYQNQYVLTAYFVPPATICRGRTPGEFAEQGTGTDLYLQNGTDPIRNSIKIPRDESNIGETMWTRGKCVNTMGMHYWYNLRADMSCDEFIPMFLLYNNGTLNGFGWVILLNLSSPRLEHPPQDFVTQIMDPPATCLKDAGTVSSLHLYLSGNPALLNRC